MTVRSKGIGYYTLQHDKIIEGIMDYLVQNPQSWVDLGLKMKMSPKTLKDFVNKARPFYLITSIKIDNWLEEERREGRLK